MISTVHNPVDHTIPLYLFSGKTTGMSNGLGDTSPQQINAIVTTGASGTIGILASLGVVGGPVGAAVGALIAVGSLIANMFHGCGQTCIVASEDANKFEVPLQQNLAAYFSVSPRYKSMQLAALNNVDTLFAALRQACSDPNLGSAGVRCISERLDPTACHWKNDGQGGPAGSGDVCWNWVVGYRNPIANDPDVQPDPTIDNTLSSAPTNSSGNVATNGRSVTESSLLYGNVGIENYVGLFIGIVLVGIGLSRL